MITDSNRNQLIADHAPAARRIAMRVARRCPTWIAREDLVSAGMVGLVEAAEHYDETRREPFIAFAHQRIRGAVLDELRRGDIMPRRKRQLARKIGQAIRDLEERGEAATEERIAERLCVTVKQYRDEMAELVNVDVAPLEEDRELATNDVAPDVEAGRNLTFDRIRARVAHLDARDARIISMYYCDDLSYQEIATTLKITPSRVCQLMTRALERLRQLLGMQMVEA